MVDVALCILHSAASNLAVDSAPRNMRVPTQQLGLRIWDDLGLPQGSPEKSSNSKPVSRASKVMKIGPKATQNHKKLMRKSTEFQLL